MDYSSGKLSEGGDKNAQQCGWLKDKLGLSWQITPRILLKFLSDPDYQKSQRAMGAMLQMKKLDIEKLRQAFEANDENFIEREER